MYNRIEHVFSFAEQERFAEIVARYEGLLSQAREAARQVEGLFQSLLALSFGGER